MHYFMFLLLPMAIYIFYDTHTQTFVNINRRENYSKTQQDDDSY